MARSIATIQAAIAADRAARPELAGLTSPSATAIYRLIEYVVAVALWAHETLWDRFRAEVDETIARAPAGTAPWYAAQALLFQLNDDLVMLPNGRLGYAAGTTGTKLVARASVKEAGTGGRLFIKVAQNGLAPGTLAPILNDPNPAGPQSFTKLNEYFDRVRFAGTRLQLVSLKADRLRLTANVYYNPLLDQVAVKAAVLAAVAGYLANLEFDGLVYVAKLEDAIQSVAGVRDVQLLTVHIRPDGKPAEAITRVYETVAGYIVAEDMPGFTLSDSLTFLPHND